MRVLAHVHMAAPHHGAGAEWMLHHLLAGLVKRGHECTIVAQHLPAGYEATFDGVSILGNHHPKALVRAHCLHDIGITHLDETPHAVAIARRVGRPLVHILHNPHQAHHWGLDPDKASLLVYNSHHLAMRAPVWARRALIIIPPPVDPWRYTVPREGRRILQVNLNPDKGGGTFWRTARKLPEYEFLGVLGAYGEQMSKPLGGARMFRNVTIWPQQEDARSFYREARLVLMPSKHESYGRVAVEAALSGIPSIVSDTPGLREALGGSATYLQPGAPHQQWVETIKRVLAPGAYEAHSERARRIVVPSAEESYDRFEEALVEARTRPLALNARVP